MAKCRKSRDKPRRSSDPKLQTGDGEEQEPEREEKDDRHRSKGGKSSKKPSVAMIAAPTATDKSMRPESASAALAGRETERGAKKQKGGPGSQSQPARTGNDSEADFQRICDTYNLRKTETRITSKRDIEFVLSWQNQMLEEAKEAKNDLKAAKLNHETLKQEFDHHIQRVVHSALRDDVIDIPEPDVDVVNILKNPDARVRAQKLSRFHAYIAALAQDAKGKWIRHGEKRYPSFKVSVKGYIRLTERARILSPLTECGDVVGDSPNSPVRVEPQGQKEKSLFEREKAKWYKTFDVGKYHDMEVQFQNQKETLKESVDKLIEASVLIDHWSRPMVDAMRAEYQKRLRGWVREKYPTEPPERVFNYFHETEAQKKKEKLESGNVGSEERHQLEDYLKNHALWKQSTEKWWDYVQKVTSSHYHYREMYSQVESFKKTKSAYVENLEKFVQEARKRNLG